MTHRSGNLPVQKLNVAALAEYVGQSPYLYDCKEPLFVITDVRIARWEEIGAFFGVSGENAMRFWVKAVVRYKVVLRKLIAAYLEGVPVQVSPGESFSSYNEWALNELSRIVSVPIQNSGLNVRNASVEIVSSPFDF